MTIQLNHASKNVWTTKQRLPVFDVPHKGVRNALSLFALLAGQTDYTTPAAVTRLYRLGKQVFRVLTLHANDKNEVTLKHLESRVPGAAASNLKENNALEALQRKLEQQLEEMHVHSSEGADISEQGVAFYQKFTELQALQLQHLLEEERATQVAMWQYFTDEELLSQRREIIARHKPEDLLLLFRFIIPALNHVERVNVLRRIKANAPAPFFTTAMMTIQELLPKEEFTRLVSML